MGGCAVVQVQTQTAAVVTVSGPNAATVLASDLAVSVVAVAEQGPPGPPGISGGGGGTAYITASASGTVSQYQAVAVIGGVATVASSADVAHAGCLAGIAVSSTQGGTFDLQLGGEVTNTGWAFTPGLVFLGPAGQVTQAPPISGFLQVIGSATDPHTVLINIQDPILFTN